MSESEDKFELKEMQKLQGHTDRVWSVAWNPVAGTNGKPPILASCSGDKTVRVWTQNPTTSAFYCMATIDEAHTRTVRSCSWSPTGHLLAVASFDGTVSIWDKIETSFKFWCYLEGHKNEVKSVSWDASGAHVATCSRDKSVCIWRVLTETEHERLATFIEHTHDVKMVQWHPCKDILFSCSYDNTIKVWPRYSDSDCWYHAQTLDHANNGHSSTVWSISFNATGEKMVTCSDDLSIKVWGPERMQSGHGHVPWKHLQTISGNHDRTIFSVHWSSEGIIASGAADDAICLFEENRDGLESEATYKLLLKKVKAHETDVNSVQWSPKEIGLLASSSDDGTVKIWKLTCRQ
ncbi:putative cytosolic iron-sulfur protein assembly protein CIAO1-like [Heracleum sosnowskyi]|uniref:Probable cytosolic iron-sulfur protein assembly protein CIAO1 homolog n=1 Tax=Heracleum sosnowskyi TaxID=360622 RepID=A0AAD8IT89_9APIA|nr:putative cytosolic iron-sulfur protein assembly protein CIAO1-like [Heracleum sosnowskyi]